MSTKQDEPQYLEEKIVAMLDELRDELCRDMAPSLQLRMSVEDVVQDVSVRSLQGLANFEYRSDAALLGWLRTIARNIVRSAIRRHCAVPNERLAEALLESGALRPSQLTARAEAVGALKQHLAQLDSRHQRVLQMKYVENLSFAEIGRATSRSDGAVRRLHHKALRRLGSLFGSASRFFS